MWGLRQRAGIDASRNRGVIWGWRTVYPSPPTLPGDHEAIPTKGSRLHRGSVQSKGRPGVFLPSMYVCVGVCGCGCVGDSRGSWSDRWQVWDKVNQWLATDNFGSANGVLEQRKDTYRNLFFETFVERSVEEREGLLMKTPCRARVSIKSRYQELKGDALGGLAGDDPARVFRGQFKRPVSIEKAREGERTAS